MGESRNTWIERGKRPASMPIAQVEENILGAFQGEGGDDHVAAALEGVRDGRVHFLDGRLHLFMEAVAVGGFHNHHVRLGRRAGLRSNGRPALPRSPENSTARRSPRSLSSR